MLMRKSFKSGISSENKNNEKLLLDLIDRVTMLLNVYTLFSANLQNVVKKVKRLLQERCQKQNIKSEIFTCNN